MKIDKRNKRLISLKAMSLPSGLPGALVIVTVLHFFSNTDCVTAQAGSCEFEWTLGGQLCYKLTPIHLTWSEAQQKCRSMNGQLAEVHNRDEQAALDNFLNIQESEIPLVWIGLNDLQTEKQWTWGSGRPMTYSNWLDNEPNNQGGNEHCVDVRPGESSRWNDDNCDRKFLGVCQKGLCPEGWTSTRGSCYQLTEAATRDAAQAKCVSLDGSLVEITNDHEQEELRDFLRTQGEKASIAWIGLRDPRRNRVWKWDSGAALTYQKWLPGEPNNQGGVEYCVVVWKSNNFEWNDESCNVPYPGVCKRNTAPVPDVKPIGTIISTNDVLDCTISDTQCRKLRQCTICANPPFQQFLDSKWLSLCAKLNGSGFCTAGIIQ